MADRLVLGQYSKQWFGLGIEDWKDGAHAADVVEAVHTAFAILGDKHLTHVPQQQAKLVLTDYFSTALAQVASV